MRKLVVKSSVVPQRPSRLRVMKMICMPSFIIEYTVRDKKKRHSLNNAHELIWYGCTYYKYWFYDVVKNKKVFEQADDYDRRSDISFKL